MFFLNYRETNLRYIYSSTLRNIYIRQNLFINNPNILKLPKIELYFIFDKIIELDLLKVSNHLVFLWLITGQRSYIKKLFSRLSKGIRYNRFVIVNKLDNEELIYIFLDFMTNVFLFLLEKVDYKQYVNTNSCFFEFKSLDFFANLRLTNNYYTSKINDRLTLKFNLRRSKHQKLKVQYVLNQFKVR